MSELLTTNAGRKVSEVDPISLKSLMSDFITQADYIMGASMNDKEIQMIVTWSCRFLNERFSYLPIHHVSKAIEAGSEGQRGGTSKLIPRNIVIWLNEQRIIHEQQCMAIEKQKDIEHIKDNYRKYVVDKDGFVGAAVRIKVTWLGEKKITSAEYDSFSSSEIYRLLKSGVKECDIRPSHILKYKDEAEIQ